MFRDGELMKEKKIFTSGDIFDNQFLDGIEPTDYVYASSLIHLFDAETQRDVCRRLSRIAKRAIAGRQVGALVAEERPGLERGLTDAKMMWHSPESFTRMWNDATNGEWQVESATFKMMDDMKLSHEGFVFVVRKRKTE